MPGDEIAAGAGDGSRLVASQADREQVLDALKAAFVQGRLTKDEFDLRVGKVLATYAELDALTADIPAGLTAAQSPEPARESHNKRLVQRGTAAGAGASVVFTGALVLAAKGSPVLGLVIGGVVGAFMAVLLAGLLTLLSWVLEKGSTRRPSQGLPPGASGRTSQRLASADPAGRPSEISPVPRHTAEATWSGLSRPPLSRLRPPHRWRIAYAQARPKIAGPLTPVTSGHSRTASPARCRSPRTRARRRPWRRSGTPRTRTTPARRTTRGRGRREGPIGSRLKDLDLQVVQSGHARSSGKTRHAPDAGWHGPCGEAQDEGTKQSARPVRPGHSAADNFGNKVAWRACRRA